MRYNKFVMGSFKTFTLLLGLAYIIFGIYSGMTAKTVDLTLIAGVGISFFMAFLLYVGSKEIKEEPKREIS